MDLKSISKILKKINRLYTLVEDLGEASSTEKDLLKAYVVDLYDAVTTSDIEDPKDLELEEMRKKLKKQRKLEKKLKKKKKVVEKKVVEKEVEEEMEEPTPSASVSAEATKIVEPIKVRTVAKPKVSDALRELFEINSGTEVSDKLAQAPIADLTKAMSINEKIFTVNELFGGNQDEMTNILTCLLYTSPSPRD